MISGEDDLWAELRTTALLGTDRRPLPAASGSTALTAAAGAVDRTDPAAALLELAALATVRRRAGLLAAEAPPAGPPVEPDGRPALPAAAARRLAVLTASRAPGSGGSSANLTELLPQWLTAAREHGYRLPAAQVPALLDAARARSELRPDVVTLAGPLGRWLAERNPDWKYVLRTVTESLPADETRIWQEGLFAERVTHLTRLRRRDPAAGLELLRSTWSTERAEDRLLFLDALQEGLSDADEPFLESTLGDRSKNVRLTAPSCSPRCPARHWASGWPSAPGPPSGWSTVDCWSTRRPTATRRCSATGSRSSRPPGAASRPGGSARSSPPPRCGPGRQSLT